MNNKISYDLYSFLFSAGCLPLLFLSKLPSIETRYFLFATLIFIIVFNFYIKNRVIIATGLLLSAFLWSTQTGIDYLNTVESYIDQKITIKAIVKSVKLELDSITDTKTNRYINFDIKEINNELIHNPLAISLLWKKNAVPAAGEEWLLNIKTKVAHSNLNQGGFDSQRFAIANRRLLMGNIEGSYLINGAKSFRQKLIDKSLLYTNVFDYGGIMQALAFGERSRLVIEHKTVMYQTGIAHLMAISGMHIMLVFYLTSRAIKGLQFLLPLRFIYYWMPLVIGFVIAALYAWLVGFNPPVMRAILALFIWLLLRSYKKQLGSWQIINRIIAILLFLDPLMILSESFWLSCYAVMCLIFIAQWFPCANKKSIRYRYFRQLVKLQLLLTLLLLPIQFLIFNGISSVTIVANLIAIPIMSLVIFPAILMMVMSSFCSFDSLAIGFGTMADLSLKELFFILDRLSDYWLYFPHQLYLFSGIGWLALIVYRIGAWRQHKLLLFLVLLLMFAPTLRHNHENWRIDMLDVGHGLAIVIRKGNQAILYDTGAKWQNSSAAERIILPFLKWHNLTVEGIIISHEHNDHIGGLTAIKQYYPNAWLMSTSAKLQNDYLCASGNTFYWQSLKLAILWPDKISQTALNSESCVVQISDGKYSILLTGDLEKPQEQQLILHNKKQLSATILQIPHHGSNTSSHYAFLAKVAPVISIGSISRYNPWKLPANKTLNRYHDLGLSYYLTSYYGQISLLFYTDTWAINTMRQQIKPRWYHDWFGAFAN